MIEIILYILIPAWLMMHWSISYYQKKRIILNPDESISFESDMPKLDIILAAKDEEYNIKSCVESLLAQNYPGIRVIVVDDRSDDNTFQILTEIKENWQNAANKDTRLELVQVDVLPDGWFGKNHAMMKGVEKSTSPYLLFLDADCKQLSEFSISSAMKYSIDKKIDFLSVNPVLESVSVFEKVIQPIAASTLTMWFPQNKVNKRRSGLAYASGQFMLMTRKCYDTIGGHKRVATEVNEDIHMSRFAKQHQQRLRVVDTNELYSSRMYATLKQMWRGWSRIYFGSIQPSYKLIVTFIIYLFFVLSPWGLLTYFLTQSSVQISSLIWSLGIVVLILQLTLAARIYTIFKVSVVYAILYPLASLFVLGMVTSSILQSMGIVTTKWRGTNYRGDQVVSQVESV